MLNQIKIRTKLLASFILTALITGFIGFMAILNLNKINNADTFLYENATAPLGMCVDVTKNYFAIRIAIRDVLITTDKEQEAKYFKEIENSNKALEDNLKDYEKTFIDEIDRKNYATLVAAKKDFMDIIPELKNLIDKNKDSVAIRKVYGEWAVLNTNFQKAATELTNYNVVYGKKLSDENTKLATSVINFLILIIVIALLVAIALGFIIASNIQNIIKSVIVQTKMLVDAALAGKLTTRADEEKTNEEFRDIVIGINKTLDAVVTPLNVAADYVAKISIGDMPPIITQNYNGDFNTLKNNLNVLIQSTNLIIDKAKQIAGGELRVELKKRSENDELMQALTEMVTAIAYVVGEVKGASENVAISSQEMTTTTEQMSQGANEQASAAEEVTSSMEEMVANIQQNTDNAQQTEKIAMKAAKDIDEGSKAVELTVQSMRNIAKKILIVSEIADKIDLLAINAAIEAARAGEHGKGFAVVASEVRKLAERSLLAAKEIDEVSSNSVSIAEKSGKLLLEIVPDIQKTARLVQEIAASSIEQNSGASQINNAIQQLNQVTQENAAASEELSSNAEELASQAEQLKDVIDFFKVNENLKDKQAKRQATQIRQTKKTNQPIKFAHLKTGGIKLNLDKHDHTDEGFESM